MSTETFTLCECMMHSSLAEKLKYKERIGNAFCVHTYAIYCNFTGVKIEFPYENLW